MIFYTVIVSLLLGVAIMPFVLPLLREWKCGQVVREEGPKSHYKKSGTPTMGGIVIIISAIIGFLLSLKVANAIYGVKFEFLKVLLLIAPLLAFGLLGFIDDYLIVIKNNNNGLSPTVKFLLQILISTVFFALYLKLNMPTNIKIFNLNIDFKWFYGIVIMAIMVSSSNAVNITDGLDGLATGLLIISFLAFMTISYLKKDYTATLFSLSIVGALIAFLFFNFHPAKIMMGDTGSLALGASLGFLAIMIKEEIILLVIGGVFIIETLSVIIQVAYFKKTRGKRLFKMSPIHHHFELCGYKEVMIVIGFYVAGIIFAIIGIFLGG